MGERAYNAVFEAPYLSGCSLWMRSWALLNTSCVVLARGVHLA